LTKLFFLSDAFEKTNFSQGGKSITLFWPLRDSLQPACQAGALGQCGARSTREKSSPRWAEKNQHRNLVRHDAAPTRYNPAQRRLRSSGTKDVQSERDAPLPDDGYVVFRLKTVLLSFLCVRYGPAAAVFGAAPAWSLNNLFARIRGVIDEGCWALL